MISVTLVDTDTYRVVVEAQTPTEHRVVMSPAYYRELCGLQVTHEWLLIQAFQFLLEREANTSILAEFELQQINQYFPEFETDLRRRLGVS